MGGTVKTPFDLLRTEPRKNECEHCGAPITPGDPRCAHCHSATRYAQQASTRNQMRRPLKQSPRFIDMSGEQPHTPNWGTLYAILFIFAVFFLAQHWDGQDGKAVDAAVAAEASHAAADVAQQAKVERAAQRAEGRP